MCYSTWHVNVKCAQNLSFFLPCQLILAEKWTNYYAVAGDYAVLDDGGDEGEGGDDDGVAAAVDGDGVSCQKTTG